MAGNFLKYAGRWDALPVDSHELVALCAPRPVFLSAGKGPDEDASGAIKTLKPGDPGVIPSRGPVEQQAANINDAWVELYNPQSQPFDLYSVHSILDSGPTTNAFYFPFGSASREARVSPRSSAFFLPFRG